MAYLTIAEAIAKHGRSESSYRRLIRDVRRSGDADRRRMIRPSEEEIQQHRAQGMSYTYTIAEQLIEQELFGRKPQPRSQQRSSSSQEDQDQHRSEWIERIEQRHQRELERMAKQLEAEKEEKRELLKYAQQDKQLFAKAAEQLTQVLALPGIAEATKAQNSSAVAGTTNAPERGEPSSTTPAETRRAADSASRAKSSSSSNTGRPTKPKSLLAFWRRRG